MLCCTELNPPVAQLKLPVPVESLDERCKPALNYVPFPQPIEPGESDIAPGSHMEWTGQDPVRPHHDIPEDHSFSLLSSLLFSSVHSCTHSLTHLLTQSLIQCFSHSFGPTLFTDRLSRFSLCFDLQPACICIAFCSHRTTRNTIQRPYRRPSVIAISIS
ncbi:hypothetical protein NA56DRAFT_11158 [Hyaloscypha hepaticicola]|uniref:Uncharacterized protein n=1 Tax=Hyaloscypha hepaticicola TaxID=2082293 RepID=A0A2J6QQ10_9HELO|nr:hypothetical protein NA56DRAFT_11158 [Hyaloscypha hepaticicola]